MSVVSVNVRGTTSCQLRVGGERSYEVVYQVITDDVNDQSPTVITAVGIPSIGQSYAVGNSFDTGAFVKSYAAELESESDDRKVWRVNVTFSTMPNENNQDSPYQYDYPWLRPARISSAGVNGEIKTEGTYTDPDNANTLEFLLNGAGGVVDDLYLPNSTPSLSIEKDFVGIDPTTAFNEYVDTVNDGTFFGFGKDYWRLTWPRWQLLYTGDGIAYFNVVFEFEWRNKWNGIEHRNEGYYYTEDGGLTFKRVADSRGAPLPSKGLLDAGGDQVWVVQNLTVNAYLRKDFSDLGVPIGF